jgi:hypothetical protein
LNRCIILPSGASQKSKAAESSVYFKFPAKIVALFSYLKFEIWAATTLKSIG